MLKRCCATLKSDWFDFAQRWFNVVSTSDTAVVSTLYNAENSTLDFVSFSTSDQVLESLFLHTLRKKARERRFKRLYGIVIRIYKLSSVCLPYCIYFVSFAKLKQCTNWYKSRLSDGFQIARLATHILAFKNHSFTEYYHDVFQNASKIFMQQHSNYL